VAFPIHPLRTGENVRTMGSQNEDRSVVQKAAEREKIIKRLHPLGIQAYKKNCPGEQEYQIHGKRKQKQK
jgi:hypothetical protein